MEIGEVNNQSKENLGSEVNRSQNSKKRIKNEDQKVIENKKDAAQARVKELTKERIEEATEKLNETVQTLHEDLQFELHDESERMFAKLVDLEKHETIKEFPPEKMLDMLGRIKKAVGLIIDEKI
jgi:flagellar protein FlaG